MTEKNLIRVYTGATSEKRIDIIIKTIQNSLASWTDIQTGCVT